MLDNPRATVGDNRPPPFDPDVVEKLNAEGAQFLDAAGKWIENGKIQSEDDAQRLNDFIAGLSKRYKAADDARKAAKRPHDDAGKAVQAAFKPILDKIDTAKQRVQPLLSDWMNEQERKRKEEAERQRKAAEFARQEAERKAAEAAARNDVSGEIDAAAAQEEADRLQKEADRAAKARTNVGSATGGGRTASLRTFVEVEVTNARVLFMRYAENPHLLACLRDLASAEARAKGFDTEKDEIPGAKITITKRAV